VTEWAGEEDDDARSGYTPHPTDCPGREGCGTIGIEEYILWEKGH